jgi:hypothetical protein
MRSSSLLVLFIVMVGSLPAGAQVQDGVSSYGVAPNPHLKAIPRKLDVVRYPENRLITMVELRGTALMPQAEGQARIETSSAGTTIETHIRDLTPAESLDPERLTYVLWAITSAGEASNLGEFVVKKRYGALTTSTKLHSFALMITAEPYFAVKMPSELVVLYNVLPDHQNRNTIRDETFHKALQFLQEAETILASGANRAAIAAEQKSREATEAAEDARSKAVQHQQESTTSP